MKKGLIALIVVLAVLIFVSPGIIGRVAEETVDESFQRAAQENAEIVVTSESFDRGWFSSEGRHRIEIRDEATQELLREIIGGDDTVGLPTLVVDTRLDHGLIPVSSMSRDGGSLAPGLASAVSTMHIEFADGETFPIPGTIYSDVGLGGSIASTYIVEAGSHATESASAEWGNANIDFAASPSGESEADGVIESLRIVADGASMAVGRIEFAGAEVPSDFDMAIGDFRIDIESVEVTENSMPTTSLGPIAISADSAVNGDRINGDMNMTITGLEVPGYGESGFDMAVRFEGFEGEALSRVVEVLETADDNVTSDQLYAMLESDLKLLTAAGFNLHIDRFNFDLPQGPVEAKMRFTLPESDASDFAWTNVLLDLDAEADLVVAREFVDFAMAMNPEAGTIVGMGFLRPNGDVYEMRAEYAKGLMTVNGAPMPIPLGQ